MGGYSNLQTGGGVKILDEGVEVTDLASQIDITGAGATATAVGSAVTLNVPAGGDNARSEVPTGTIDGSNKSFVLAHTPTTGTLKVYLNGLRQKVTDDYTLATATIIFVIVFETGSNLICDYSYV